MELYPSLHPNWKKWKRALCALTNYYAHVCCMICDIYQSINQSIIHSINQTVSRCNQTICQGRMTLKISRLDHFWLLRVLLGPLDRPNRGPQPLVLCLSNSNSLDEGSWIDNQALRCQSRQKIVKNIQILVIFAHYKSLWGPWPFLLFPYTRWQYLYIKLSYPLTFEKKQH